jgi:hypothetical protein
VIGYNATNKENTSGKKELKKNNKTIMDFISEELPDLVREKVGKFSSTKEIWDKLHNIYSSPIIELKNVKEYAGVDQEEIFSSYRTNLEEEEYIVNKSMFFFFNCEKCIHHEIECPEGNEAENPFEIEENYEE